MPTFHQTFSSLRSMMGRYLACKVLIELGQHLVQLCTKPFEHYVRRVRNNPTFKKMLHMYGEQLLAVEEQVQRTLEWMMPASYRLAAVAELLVSCL